MCAQETGRAGRDGALAAAILYYSYGDAQKSRHMLRQSAEETRSPPEQLQCNLDSLNRMVRVHGDSRVVALCPALCHVIQHIGPAVCRLA